MHLNTPTSLQSFESFLLSLSLSLSLLIFEVEKKPLSADLVSLIQNIQIVIEMLAMATRKALVPQVVSGRALARKVASAPARLRGQAAASVRVRRRVTTTRLQATSSNGDTLGVIIVDHGSKKKDSNEMLDAFADLYKRKTGRDLVEVAHMELCEPSIETALTKCYSRGARDIVVAPYFLSPGK